MKDFLPNGTGNSRTLKSVSNFLSLYPTYADFAAAMVAGNVPIDLGAPNPAGYTELGSSLSKSTILPDSLATALGLNPSDDPLLKDALRATAPWRLLQAYTTAGTFVFDVPQGVIELGAFVVGGGGGGKVTIKSDPSTTYGAAFSAGAGSGHTNFTIIKKADLAENYTVVVGQGGQTSGASGGTSSFGGTTATGGSGGSYQEMGGSITGYIGDGVGGGQGSSGRTTKGSTPPAFGEMRVAFDGYQGATNPQEARNPFDGKRLLIAGGGVVVSDYASAESGIVTDDYGNTGSRGFYSTTPVTPVKGTSYGCGGGSIFIKASSATQECCQGCDGAVLIYGRG